MFLEHVANIIYTPKTDSENRLITVKTYRDNRVLWKGKAKELARWVKENHCRFVGGWIVVEILIDTSDKREMPDYNKGKVITVI